MHTVERANVLSENPREVLPASGKVVIALNGDEYILLNELIGNASEKARATLKQAIIDKDTSTIEFTERLMQRLLVLQLQAGTIFECNEDIPLHVATIDELTRIHESAHEIVKSATKNYHINPGELNARDKTALGLV